MKTDNMTPGDIAGTTPPATKSERLLAEARARLEDYLEDHDLETAFSAKAPEGVGPEYCECEVCNLSRAFLERLERF